MSKVLISKDKLDTLSERIKGKAGLSENLTIDEMTNVVDSLVVNDLDIDGVIKQYRVLAGETISAGSFIEFINTITSTTTTAADNGVSCVLLEENKIFMTHGGSSDRLYGTIVTIDGTNMTFTTKTINSTSYSCYYGNPSCVLLEENKIFIAYGHNSNYTLYGAIVTINGTDMSVTTSAIGGTKSIYSTIDCILLEKNKVFIAHNNYSPYCLCGTIVSIDGTTMTAVNSILNSDSGSCNFNASARCVLLENNKVFIAYGYGTSSSSSARLYGTTVVIDGTTMTATHYVLKEAGYNLNYGCTGEVFGCILVGNNKVFVAYATGSDQHLSSMLVNIDGSNVSTSSHTVIDSSGVYKGRSILLENNKIFIVYSPSGGMYQLKSAFVEIDGNTITVTKKMLNDKLYRANYNYPDCLALSDGKIFIAHHYYPANGSEQLASSIYIGDKVKNYTDKIDGVASMDGSDGALIDVVVPNVQ